MAQNYRQILAKQKSYEGQVKRACPSINNRSGIYILTRVNENDENCFYVGQAKHLLQRMCGHMIGYQHIDLSLKKHHLANEYNPDGWHLDVFECPESELDQREREYITKYLEMGYITYNHTTGGQGEGKEALGETKSPKTYRDGLKQGYKNAVRDINNCMKWLETYVPEDTPSSKLRYAEKAREKLLEILENRC